MRRVLRTSNNICHTVSFQHADWLVPLGRCLSLVSMPGTRQCLALRFSTVCTEVSVLSIAAAYKHADGKKLDGRRVLVDVERGRTVKGWRPRRLGEFCSNRVAWNPC